MSGVAAAIAAGLVVALVAGAASSVVGPIAAAALLALAGFAAVGWSRARAREAAAEARHASDCERQDRHLRGLEGARERERQLIARLRQSWEAEREWSRELREQIHRIRPADGTPDRTGDDLHALILKAAIRLVEAQKGMLISRQDEDGDGALDVVQAEGFEHDPTHSAVAQRFARAVLARDEILRDDDPPAPGDSEATRADGEIDTLVAIPLYLKDRFHGVIVCANRAGGFEDVGDEMLLALGDHAGAALHHGRLEHELRDAHRSALRVLVEAVAAHDPVLHRETSTLAVHAGLLAEELGLDQRSRDVVVCATLLRAVGYLALPDQPRLRPGELNPDERALIELHPRIGFNVLMQAPALHDAATAVLYHHERVDGAGYPAGLAGQDIPLAARILAVVEAYGALTHERPYRTPLTPEAACETLVEAAGTQLDPEIVQLFVEQVRRSPRLARDDVSEAVLDALPLEPGGAVDGLSGLGTETVDAATLLGNHQRLHQDVSAAAEHSSPFGVLVLELIDLPRVNEETGFAEGDRLIEQAARSARRVAARLGGTAYRVSGRRLGILVPARDGQLTTGMLDEVQTEFLPGPAIRAAMAAWSPGETGESVLARAREALKQDVA